MTPAEMAAPLAAYLHYESRRRGSPMTQWQLEREHDLAGTGCDIADFRHGRVPVGGYRELRIVEALTAAIESGVAALEAELAELFSAALKPRAALWAARAAARYLYGLTEKGGAR